VITQKNFTILEFILYFLFFVTFGYKLYGVYDVLLVKRMYYLLNGIIGCYLIFKYYKNAINKLDKNYVSILFLGLIWIFFSSLFNGLLSILLGILSSINILLWSVVLPYLLVEKRYLYNSLTKVLLFFLLLSVLVVFINPDIAYSDSGRLKAIFIDVAPLTNFLIISFVFLFPLEKVSSRWLILTLIIVLQLMTKTRSSILITLISGIFIIYIIRSRGQLAKTLFLIYCMTLFCAVTLLLLLYPNLTDLNYLNYYRLDNISYLPVREEGYHIFMNIKQFIPSFMGSSLDDRLLHWSNGIYSIKENPISGRGLGGT